MYHCDRCGTPIESGNDGVLQQKDYDALCWACYDATITEGREAAQREEANREDAKQEQRREDEARWSREHESEIEQGLL